MVRNKNNIILLIVLSLIYIGGFFLWGQNLEKDPPIHDIGLGQSLSTDPHHYVYHARNKIVFDDCDPFNFERWTVFKHTIVSFFSYLIFKISGVSIYTANLTGLILNLLALLLFILALLKYLRITNVIVFSILYLFNTTLFIHSRLPYLENGLLFLIGLLFYLHSFNRRDKTMLIAYGAIIALAAFTGKLFGILLLPASMATVYFTSSRKRFKQMSLVLISCVVSSVLLVLILYGKNYHLAFSYFSEQSYDLRGFPEGLSGPLAFFEHLISYGLFNKLHDYSFELVFFLFFAAVIFFGFKNKSENLSKNSPIILFSGLWLVIFYLGLMPLNYSPIRYSVILIPSIFIFTVTVIDRHSLDPVFRGKRLSVIESMLLVIIFWFFIFHAVAARVSFFENTPVNKLIWSIFPIAVVLVLILNLLLKKIKFTGKYLMILPFVLVAISLLFNYKFYFSDQPQNTNAVDDNQDLSKIVSLNSVISGPYAPLLTTENELSSFIYQFGLKNLDDSIFFKYPITHLLVDRSNYQAALKRYPELSRLKPITKYWIRGYDVWLYNIAYLYDNPQANKYEMTDFEKAAQFFSEGFIDSAFVRLDSFALKQGRTKSGDLMMANLLFNFGNFDKAVFYTDRLVKEYPSDFNLWLSSGEILHKIGLIKNDQSLINRAQNFYEQATALDPFQTGRINDAYLRIQDELER